MPANQKNNTWSQLKGYDMGGKVSAEKYRKKGFISKEEAKAMGDVGDKWESTGTYAPYSNEYEKKAEKAEYKGFKKWNQPAGEVLPDKYAGGGNVWKQLKGYETGGQPDPLIDTNDEEDNADTTQPLTATPPEPVTDASTTTPPRLPARGLSVSGPAPMPQSKSAPLDINEQYQELLKNYIGNNKSQELYDTLKGQMEGNRDERSSKAGLARLADYYYGTHLKDVYKQPGTPEDETKSLMAAQTLVDKSQQGPLQELAKLYGINLSNKTKISIAGLKGSQDHKDEQKAIKDMQTDMLLKRSTNPQVSQSLNKLQRATSAVALMDSIDKLSKDPNNESGQGPTPGEMSNIATALAGMVTGGNVVTNEKLKEIMPSNVDLTAAGISQWFMSAPFGADQQAFLKRFRNEIDAEAIAARNTLNNYQESAADGYLGRVNPKTHKQLRDSGRKFINGSYYDPTNPKAYLQGYSGEGAAPAPASAPGRAPSAQGALPTSSQPPPGAVPKMSKSTGKKFWQMPDGKLIPR